MSTWVNLLDYTASVFPVTKVDKSIDLADDAYKPLNELDKKVQDSCKFASQKSLVRIVQISDEIFCSDERSERYSLTFWG